MQICLGELENSNHSPRWKAILWKTLLATCIQTVLLLVWPKRLWASAQPSAVRVRVCACVCACAERLTAEQRKDGACPKLEQRAEDVEPGDIRASRESATGTSPHTRSQQDPSFSLKRQCSRPHHVGTREQTEKDLRQALVKAEQDRCEKKKSAGTASEAMRQGERCLDVYLLGHISPSHARSARRWVWAAQLASARREGMRGIKGRDLQAAAPAQAWWARIAPRPQALTVQTEPKWWENQAGPHLPQWEEVH